MEKIMFIHHDESGVNTEKSEELKSEILSGWRSTETIKLEGRSNLYFGDGSFPVELEVVDLGPRQGKRVVSAKITFMEV